MQRTVKYKFHSNPNYLKCLKAVNEAGNGISTWMVYLETKLKSRQQVYGFLSRLREAGMITGKGGIWKPVCFYPDEIIDIVKNHPEDWHDRISNADIVHFYIDATVGQIEAFEQYVDHQQK